MAGTRSFKARVPSHELDPYSILDDIFGIVNERAPNMLRVAALFFSALICGSLQADVFECRDCNDQEYKQRARAAGIGEHLVFDFAREKLNHFMVDCPGTQPLRTPGDDRDRLARIREATIAAGSCAYPLRVVALPVDPAYQASFERATEFYKAAGRDDVLMVELDMDDVDFADQHIQNMSAYDIVSSGNARNQFADWLHPGHDLPLSARAEAAMTAILQDALGALFNGSLEVLITVTFRDGTSVQYEWKLSSNSIKVVPESGRVDGNLIPDDLGRQAQGIYRFSDPNVAAGFVAWLISQGIPVVDAQSTYTRVTCTWDGQELNCRRGG